MRTFRSAAVNAALVLAVFGTKAPAQLITLNSTPTRVIGQLSTSLANINPNLVEGREFNSPQGLAIDSSVAPALLYVADTQNNRVLGFRNASAFANGQAADIVIGQPDFLTTIPQGPSATTRTTGLSSPEGLAVDNSGNLYVLDAGNNRVLRFPKPFSQAPNVFPDIVIGQPSLTTAGVNQGGISAATLAITPVVSGKASSPLSAGVAFDPSGNLWVTDSGNNRILRFNASVLGSQASSGPYADVVLGQNDFVTGAGATPALTSFTGIANPSSLVFDSQGRLFATEGLTGRRGRVMVWLPPFTSGQSAAKMLGVNQSSLPPINQYQFQQAPTGLFTVGDQIGVCDLYNSRLLIFPPLDQWNLNLFYQSAIAVVGQTGFAGGSANQGLAQAGPSTLNNPIAAFFYNSELYVADATNNRVVVMPQGGGSFGPATRVLGQVQLNYNAVNLIEGREFNFTNSGQNADAGMAVDFSGAVPHLYVADPYNNRILCYYDLRNFQAGQFADMVIGQPDFYSSVGNYPNGTPTSSNLQAPIGLAVDIHGNLFVADTGNARVLRFRAPFAGFTPGTRRALGQAADLVLGQLGFTTRITDATAQTMITPYGVAFAGDNGLAVSDLGHNRVLFFAGPADSLVNGQAAAIVFGQPDMISSASGSGLNQFSGPHHIAIDTDDRLYVADTGNGRVMLFNRVPTAGNGSFAALNLTTGLSAPIGIHVNSYTGDIWVADPVKGVAERFSKFADLLGSGNFAPNAALGDFGPLALAEDNWGNVYVADDANRVVIFYPGLSVLNAANYLGITSRPIPFLLAPNEIAALYSTGFSGQFGTTSESATTVPLPKTLNGIQVTLNGTPAPLFFAGPDQINFVAPSNAPQSGGADLQVIEVATGRVLGDSTVAMNGVSPGIFTQNASGSGAGVIANQDGTLNTAANPAVAGTIVTIYLTGQGYIPGMPADGDVMNAALSTPYRPLVYIGGTNFVPDSSITYSGLAPTLVGVWQINVKIPIDVVSLPASPVQVLVQANSIPSGGAALGRPVYIYVKAPK